MIRPVMSSLLLRPLNQNPLLKIGVGGLSDGRFIDPNPPGRMSIEPILSNTALNTGPAGNSPHLLSRPIDPDGQ